MKLLLDTNILLDCMMDRQPFAADVRKLLILGALGVDWQPFSGHFFQRLRPAFLNSTGLM